jgi:DNA-binding IclR family transcriptional regulator
MVGKNAGQTPIEMATETGLPAPSVRRLLQGFKELKIVESKTYQKGTNRPIYTMLPFN